MAGSPQWEPEEGKEDFKHNQRRSGGQGEFTASSNPKIGGTAKAMLRTHHLKERSTTTTEVKDKRKDGVMPYGGGTHRHSAKAGVNEQVTISNSRGRKKVKNGGRESQ